MKPYRVIAEYIIKECSLSQGPKAEELAYNETIENLENGVDGKLVGVEARRVIDSVTKGILKGLKDRNIEFFLGETRENILFDAVMNDEDSDISYIFSKLKQSLSQVKDKESFVLEILATVYCDESLINDEMVDDITRFHLYIDTFFIGWEEASKYLDYIEPILNAVGMEIDKEKLEKSYYNIADKIRIGNIIKALNVRAF